MTTIVGETKKILDFAYNFSEIVKKGNWVSRYDIESDSFSLAVPQLPDDARIKYFNDEVAFYITQNNDIKGIFVEYFRSNFVKHHKDFKELLKDVKQKKEDEGVLIELEKNKVNRVISKFEEIIQESLAKNVKFEPAI